MTVSLSVKGDVKDVMRSLRRIDRRIVPKITARALNKAGETVRQETAKQVGKDLRIAPKRMKRRFDRNGKPKGDRIRLFKANRTRLAADLTVYLRPIPVIQLARVKQTKKGVRAEGGRFYRGAFIQTIGGGSKQVMRRVRPDVARYPVTVLKVPIASRLRNKAEELLDEEGADIFRKEFERLARVELARPVR